MKIKILFKTARCVTIEIRDDGIFETKECYRIEVNGKLYGKTNQVVTSIYGLKPDTEYEIEITGEKKSGSIAVKTDYEYVTLNVKDFGAKGDGKQDDTEFIQAAFLSCPKHSRVLIPKGIYKITSLFLKDNLIVEMEKGAVLSAFTDRTKFPVLPGLIESYDEEKEYNLGTWEGNPLDMFSGIITGIQVRHVVFYGQGVIDGNAGAEEGNWWFNPKVRNIAFRPRMIFLNRCKDITIQGIQVQNSPSWNIHPYFSEKLQFIDLKVVNPKDSPNTDGLDPESCKNVDIIGVYFSVGDDCIAVKSGKIYMGAKYKTPSEHIRIRQCCMRDGHGSVTLGSEMAGGINNLSVKECRFIHTDRGLRIKTRRGRGKQAVIHQVTFERIEMDQVMTPFVVNCFYYCDPDGHTEYVRTKDELPVDERTPRIGRLVFKHIEARACHVAAAYFYGLPEQKIERIEMEHVHITYDKNAQSGIPAMMDGLEPMCRKGIYANQVKTLVLKDVKIEGQSGKDIETENTNVIY